MTDEPTKHEMQIGFVVTASSPEQAWAEAERIVHEVRQADDGAILEYIGPWND